MSFNETDVKKFFDKELPKVLIRSDEEIESFMAKFGTNDEWLQKRNVTDYKKDSLSSEELKDMKDRAYDVEYMSEILVENITLYTEEEYILNNMKIALESMQ